MNNTNATPQDLEALLPWHAAGTLNRRDAQEVENAVARSPELARRLALAREEMNETTLLNESLGTPSARAMETLFKAIDKERQPTRAGSGILAWLSDIFSPRVLAFSAAAAAVIILVQAGVITGLVMEEGAGPAYQTASAPPATRGFEASAYALVRFAPQATITDITRFLDSRGAAIVDGPRPGAIYRVRIARALMTKDELDNAVKQFQAASSLVVFAAPSE
jgi:anti-sigma factor RsiW